MPRLSVARAQNVSLDVSPVPLNLGICAKRDLLECIVEAIQARRFSLRPGEVLDLCRAAGSKQKNVLQQLEEAVGYDKDSGGFRIVEVPMRGVTLRFLMGANVSEREVWGRLELMF